MSCSWNRRRRTSQAARRGAAWSAAAVLACLSATSGAARPTVLLATIPTTGTAYSAALAGGRLYAAEGAEGLAVYSLADPESPALVQRLPAAAPALDVAVWGEWAYAALGEHGVESFHVAPDATLVSFGRTALSGGAERVAVGTFGLAVAMAYEGFAVLDLESPEAPRLRAVMPTADRVFGLAAQAARLLVADGRAGLVCYDVARPDAPAEQWRLNPGGTALDAAWAGTQVLSARAGAGWECYALADPAPPQLLAHFDGPAFSLTVHGATAFVGSAAVRVYDLGAGESPTLRGDVNLPGAAMRLATADGLVAAASQRDGISLCRIDPEALAPTLGRVGGFAFARRVDVRGTLAAVADAGVGVRLVDVADPSAPVLLGQFAPFDPYDVHFHDGALLASDPQRGLATLDVSNPLLPSLAAFHEKASGAAYGFRVAEDGTAVLGVDPYGLKLTRAATGELLGVGSLYVLGREAAVLGSTAYVGGEDDDLRIYDVADRANPRQIGRLALPRARRIHIDPARRRAYVAAGEHGVYILDLTDPRAPQSMGHARTWDAHDFEPVGSELGLAADGPHGMAVIDLANPVRPRLLFHCCPWPGDLLQDIAVEGTRAYLAYGEAGLVIVSLEGLREAATAARSWALFR